jgi:hypothetical protein
MTPDQYITDLERRIKKLEGNDAFRDSEIRAIRKLAESAERQVRYLKEPYDALNSYLDRFHAPKESQKVPWLCYVAVAWLGGSTAYMALDFGGWLK